MLISKKMNAALNEQIGNEFGASLQYVAIASYFAREGLNELATRFFKQADEERDHAMRFVSYLNEAGGDVKIPGIPAAKNTFATVAEAVKLSLTWEQTVTRQINALMDLAVKEGDHIAQNFLGWFVREQLEEVSSMDNLLKLVLRAGEANLVYVEAILARNNPKTESPEAEAAT